MSKDLVFDPSKTSGPQYFGPACADGAFPGRLSEAPWYNLYVAWAFVGYYKGDSKWSWLQRMAVCRDRAMEEGRPVYLSLDAGRTSAGDSDMSTGDMLHAVLSVWKPAWSNVIAVDIADEPNWNRRKAKDMFLKVRKKMEELQLDEAHGRARPLGITLTHAEAQAQGSHSVIDIPTKDDDGKLFGPEFVTLELFGQPQNLGQSVNLEYIKGNINASLSRLPSDKKLWFYLQGFDRNGAFKGEADLAALNKQSYQFVRGKSGIDIEGFLSFNWARATGPDHSSMVGTKWLPLVQQAHQWIASDMGIV